MIYFYIEDKDCNIIWSNLTDKIDKERKILLKQKSKKFVNPINTISLDSVDGYSLYMYISDSRIHSSEYKRHKEMCINYIEALSAFEKLITKRENFNHDIFKHNMTNNNAIILQALYNIIPYDKIPGNSIEKQKEFIKKCIYKDIEVVVDSLITLIRFSRFINFEIDIYSFLQGKTFDIEIQKHSIHKLLTLILQLFMIPFNENRIHIQIEDNKDYVLVDYKTISIAFYNILHNLLKYVMSDSTVDVKFLDEEGFIVLEFHMISLKIEDAEIMSIFEKGIVGKWAKSSKKDGTGVGMYMAKELLILNKGDIFFEINNDVSHNHSGYPYQYNILRGCKLNCVSKE